MYLLGSGVSPGYGTALVQRVSGLGGCGCGGKCGGCGDGLGLFDSGMDLASWGIKEWAVAGVGIFALFSMFSTTRRGVSAVSGGVQRRRARRRKEDDLRRRRDEADSEYREFRRR